MHTLQLVLLSIQQLSVGRDSESRSVVLHTMQY